MNIREFEAFGISAREMTTAKFLIFSPLINDVAMRADWEDFSGRNADWIEKGHTFYSDFELRVDEVKSISSEIYRIDGEGEAVRDSTPGPYSPAWQMSPPPTDTELVNFNFESTEIFAQLAAYTLEKREAILSEPVDLKTILCTIAPESNDGPHSILLQPVFDSFDKATSSVVGHIAAVIPWSSYLTDVSLAFVTYSSVTASASIHRPLTIFFSSLTCVPGSPR